MKKIVTIGGGTGSFTLLSGLKNYPVELSAIVSMADDGGSTGILRDELGVLPPGDIRQCLVALSESSSELRQLMNYRFEEGGLKGHSFGNIFLSALEKINGNFLDGLAVASKILNVKGEVIPVTDSDIDLCMELKDGLVLNGEEDINHNFDIEKIGCKKFYLKPKAKANRRAIQKILEADMIIMGPGNFYCSVLPNLLVDGIAGAICKSKATVVLNCNLVNKRGHTEKFSLDDYADAINGFLGKERINFITFNDKKPLANVIKKYREQCEFLVSFDKAARKSRNYKVIVADLLSDRLPKYAKSDTLASQRAFIRHDTDKLAKILIFISELESNRDLIEKIY